MEGLEITAYDGEGYRAMIRFGGWRVALLRYAENFDRISYLERHLNTDEVFVLLEGQATLLIGAAAEEERMRPGLLYRVGQGVWHNIRVSRDARVLVVENDDTSKDNSEFLAL